MPTQTKLKDVTAGQLISQTSGGMGSTIRLVTYVDQSATPVYTWHFADGGSITADTLVVGDVFIFQLHGTIL